MSRHYFTASEEKYLKNNFSKVSSKQIALQLGCSKSKVLDYFKRNNFKMSQDQVNSLRNHGNTGRTTFTPKMDAFLIENYLKMPVKPLGKEIGKSGTGVMIRLRQLGLKIPKEIRESRKKIGQRKPGQVPGNKGKKMTDYLTPEKIENVKKNQFKKGHKPHNTAKANGEIRIRKDSLSGISYKYIRVALGEWELLSRVTWQQHRGEIPPLHVIRFKNSDSLDCRLENLECISMAKNLNLNWHQYPLTLRKVIRLTRKIEKEL